MNFRKQLSPVQTGFQIAPLIDVVFLSLIFFMVAAVTAKWETKMGIVVPTADSGVRAPRELGEIIINLDADGRIFIQNVEMSAERLESVLRTIAREYKGQPVIIRADGKTAHEHVIGVLDICRRVDIWNIGFATLPPPKEKARKGGAP
ncbi:MAG: biopolymer transporter ExbD [Lentisphaeria bacterium]|jgi:biopolymer transport protein ExbD